MQIEHLCCGLSFMIVVEGLANLMQVCFLFVSWQKSLCRSTPSHFVEKHSMVYCGEMSQCHMEFGSENLVFIMKFIGKGVNSEEV